MKILFTSSILATSIMAGCTHATASFPVSKDTVEAGSTVQAGGKPVKLYNEGGNIAVGKPITAFWDTLGAEQPIVGKVALINVVPSVDTAVCEEQTHLLGESKILSPDVMRVSISRDLPMAQKRFAKEAKLTNIVYLSDYKTGAFGKTSGLMMQGSELLARGVIVVDKKGVIRHLQIVPNVATLPDLDKAISVANTLAEEK